MGKIIFFLENPLTSGVLSGILSVIVWESLRWLFKRISYFRRYSKFKGTYKAYPKYINEKDYSDTRPTKIWDVHQHGNKLIIHGKSIAGLAQANIVGEILMNPELPNYGVGFYQHLHIEEQRARFGFVELQLSYPYILVHETIYDGQQQDSGKVKGIQNCDGYRWVRIKDGIKEG